LLEIVAEFGNSTVWDESFPTDQTALAGALRTIDIEGIAAVMGSAPSFARVEMQAATLQLPWQRGRTYTFSYRAAPPGAAFEHYFLAS
jgi:hypothetical protein